MLADPQHLVLAAAGAEGDVVGWRRARLCLEIAIERSLGALGLVVAGVRQA